MSSRIRRWFAWDVFAQVALIVVTVAAVSYAVWIGSGRLRSLGLASGFGFLAQPAGFDIGESLIAYDHASTYGRALLVALLNTIAVAAAGIALATALGFVIGIGQLSTNLLARALCRSYVAVFRNIPPLLQIFFWYFAVLRSLPGVRNSVSLLDVVYLNNRGVVVPKPILPPDTWLVLGAIVLIAAGLRPAVRALRLEGRLATQIGSPAVAILIAAAAITALCLARMDWQLAELRGFNFHGGLTITPEFAALLFGLTVYTSAFVAEIVRAGLTSVPRGQYEAARSLGLERWQILRLVVIPQALRLAIPPLTSQYLNLTKNTSLGSAVAYPELVSVFAGTAMNQTGQAVETIGITMGLYLALSLAIAALMQVYERRTAHVSR